MELWTLAHAETLLPAIAVMVLIAIILRKLIGNKSMKIRMIPFQIMACIIIALETGKQFLSFSRGYDLYHIPLHFCSLFIFALPLMSFYNGKHKQTVTGVTAALCTSVVLLMLIYPNLIYSAGNIENFFGDFMDFHTVAFHNIVIFEFLLIVFLNLHTPDKKRDPKAAVIFIMCYCAVAATMAQILKTNYANFYTCNIPVFESLRITLQGVIGAGLTQLLYVLIVAALNVLFVFMSYWVYCLFSSMLKKVTPSIKQTA